MAVKKSCDLFFKTGRIEDYLACHSNKDSQYKIKIRKKRGYNRNHFKSNKNQFQFL